VALKVTSDVNVSVLDSVLVFVGVGGRVAVFDLLSVSSSVTDAEPEGSVGVGSTVMVNESVKVEVLRVSVTAMEPVALESRVRVLEMVELCDIVSVEVVSFVMDHVAESSDKLLEFVFDLCCVNVAVTVPMLTDRVGVNEYVSESV